MTVMPNFAQRVEVAVDALSSNPPKDVDENEFIDASRLVYDGVREIRRAVLMNRTDEELDQRMWNLTSIIPLKIAAN
ncbi:catenin alpha-2-like, partial [Nilaparvata lugens]|uniref:catenin alpha-2-like n=1 Tax=Nilaparvata lugens TaxID=108931 RepID=UPI00193CFE48